MSMQVSLDEINFCKKYAAWKCYKFENISFSITAENDYIIVLVYILYFGVVPKTVPFRISTKILKNI